MEKEGTLILKSNHIVIVVLTFYKQTEGNFYDIAALY